MKPPLDLPFDFSSPYGYIASEIEALASKHGRSPFFSIDGEPFCGVERLDQVERPLATGGW